jgi:hypothetical protein
MHPTSPALAGGATSAPVGRPHGRCTVCSIGRIKDLFMKSGFAFLEYERADDADYAIRKLDGMNSRILRARPGA